MFSSKTLSHFGNKYRRPLKAKLTIEALEERLLLNAGDLDIVFGGDGRAITDFGSGPAHVQALAVQPDGKIVAVGGGFDLARYNLNGSLDAGFGSAGKVSTNVGPTGSGVAESVAIQNDGKIVVAGYAATAARDEFALARYNANGSLDASFGSGGTVVTDLGGSATAKTVAIEPDGTIVVAGSVQPDPSQPASSFALARYHSDGSLDTTFGTAGKVITQFGQYDAAANKVVIQPDGGIVAAGHTSTSSAFFNFALARYNPSGSLDASFGSAGKDLTHFDTFDDATDLALQADGKLLAVGSTLTGGKTELALARFNADGSLDASFGSGGKSTTDLGGLNQAARAVALLPDGRFLVAGVYAPRGPSQFFVARFTSAGALDSSFGDQGKVLTGFAANTPAEANSLALVPGGTFVAAGSSGSSFALARYWGDQAPPSFAQGSADAVFVAQVYEDVLGRPVDASGLATWTGAIAQGLSRSWVVQAITGSTEYRTRVVDRLYETFLGRQADSSGLGTFVTALGLGATVEQVEAALLGSPEYFQRAGGTSSAYLSTLYRDVLGRSIDVASSQTWSAALAAGAGRNHVASLVLTSGESRQDLVEELYQQYLHRSADQGGLATWLGQLQSGAPDETILSGILGSAEFYQWL